MDRRSVAEFEQAQVAPAMAEGKSDDRWNRLVEPVDEDAARLLQLVCRITPAERIDESRKLESGPADLGSALQAGAPCFVERGLTALGASAPDVPSGLAEHITALHRILSS